MENDLSRWSRIRRLVARNACRMGKPAKVNLERIVYNQVPKRETRTAPDLMVSRNDCQPKNAIILTLQTTCLERNGSVLERRVEDE